MHFSKNLTRSQIFCLSKLGYLAYDRVVARKNLGKHSYMWVTKSPNGIFEFQKLTSNEIPKKFELSSKGQNEFLASVLGTMDLSNDKGYDHACFFWKY